MNRLCPIPCHSTSAATGLLGRLTFSSSASSSLEKSRIDASFSFGRLAALAFRGRFPSTAAAAAKCRAALLVIAGTSLAESPPAARHLALVGGWLLVVDGRHLLTGFSDRCRGEADRCPVNILIKLHVATSRVPYFVLYVWMSRNHFAIAETRSYILPHCCNRPSTAFIKKILGTCAALGGPVHLQQCRVLGLGNNEKLWHKRLKPDSCLCNGKMEERRVMHTVKLSERQFVSRR